MQDSARRSGVGEIRIAVHLLGCSLAQQAPALSGKCCLLELEQGIAVILSFLQSRSSDFGLQYYEGRVSYVFHGHCFFKLFL